MSDAYIKRLMIIIGEYNHIINLFGYGSGNDLKLIDDFLERLEYLNEENRYALISNIEKTWLNRFVKIIKNGIESIKAATETANKMIEEYEPGKLQRLPFFPDVPNKIENQRKMIENFSRYLHGNKR